MTAQDFFDPSDEKDIFGAVIVICTVLCALCVAFQSERRLEEEAYKYIELDLPSDTELRTIFKNVKEAPDIEDIAARYETPDSALYNSLYTSVRNAYAHELMTGRQLSFGNFISQYYYANATDSVHPWLLWYEAHPEFRNE